MQKQKTTNLHDFEYELFLGFLSEQISTENTHQISFIGGQPLWINEPNDKLLRCQDCTIETQQMTFIGQIFCPLNADHCYNRILYLFYCQKCRKSFRCLKQQSPQSWSPSPSSILKKYKSISLTPFQIQSDAISRKQFLKQINRSKIQVQQEIILEQQDEDDDEEGEEVVVNVEKLTGKDYKNKLEEVERKRIDREYSEKEVDEINRKFEELKINDKEEKEGETELKTNKTDYVFEQYRKTMKSLNNPILIYSNIPIPYNKQPLNPRHFCKKCNSKMQLQFQITQKILSLNKQLVLLDWGSLFIYVCTSSCLQSEQQCIVVQYEMDAISQDDINKLKKTKKNRKRNKNKSLQKNKNKSQQNEVNAIQEKDNDDNEEKEQGDWD